MLVQPCVKSIPECEAHGRERQRDDLKWLEHFRHRDGRYTRRLNVYTQKLEQALEAWQPCIEIPLEQTQVQSVIGEFGTRVCINCDARFWRSSFRPFNPKATNPPTGTSGTTWPIRAQILRRVNGWMRT